MILFPPYHLHFPSSSQHLYGLEAVRQLTLLILVGAETRSEAELRKTIVFLCLFSKQRCLYFSPLLALLTTTATNKTRRARAKVENLMVDWLMQLERIMIQQQLASGLYSQ